MTAPAVVHAPSASEVSAAPRPVSKRKRVTQFWKGVGVAVLLVYSLFPAYWLVSTGFDARASARGASLLPKKFTLDNFVYVLTTGNFLNFMKNSAIIAVSTVVIASAVALFAAIAVSRFKFPFRKAILIMILIVQMVPLEALVIPLFLQANRWHMLNSYIGLIIVYLAFSLPFAVWTLRGFVAAVPVELEEAAYLDGCTWWQMFAHVLFPLVAPGLVSTSVFAFITAWDEFIFALTFLQDDSKYTVAIGLKTFFGQNTADWGPIMAASTLIALPVVIFFMIVQGRMSSGLLAGATKG